jgi:hypothetical protein
MAAQRTVEIVDYNGHDDDDDDEVDASVTAERDAIRQSDDTKMVRFVRENKQNRVMADIQELQGNAAMLSMIANSDESPEDVKQIASSLAEAADLTISLIADSREEARYSENIRMMLAQTREFTTAWQRRGQRSSQSNASSPQTGAFDALLPDAISNSARRQQRRATADQFSFGAALQPLIESMKNEPSTIDDPLAADHDRFTTTLVAANVPADYIVTISYVMHTIREIRRVNRYAKNWTHVVLMKPPFRDEFISWASAHHALGNMVQRWTKDSNYKMMAEKTKTAMRFFQTWRPMRI